MNCTESSLYWYLAGRTRQEAGATMELLWLVLTLLAVDLAALLFAADTRPGLQHSARPGLHLARRPSRRSAGG
jgi:hypothetical protein